MAGSKTDFHEDAVLNTARGTTLTNWTPYVGILTATSNGETSSVTEVSGNNYARQSVTFGAPSSGAMTNSGLITFPTPSGSWGTPTGLIVADAVSAGNIRYYSDLSNSPGAIASGNTVTIAIGALSVSEG
jgi:hypothetical protein